MFRCVSGCGASKVVMVILVIYVHMCRVTLVSQENQTENIVVILLLPPLALLFLYSVYAGFDIFIGCLVLRLCFVDNYFISIGVFLC